MGFGWDLALGILLLLLCGCEREEPAVAPTSALRIVSIAPSLTEILFAIGAGDNVVGVTTHCNFPPEARTREQVGDVALNREKLVLLKPDFVVADEALNRSQIEDIRRLGIAVRGYRSGGIDAILRTVAELGRDCRREKEAAALADKIRRKIDDVRQRAATRRKPRVLFEVGADPIFVAGPGSHIDDAIRLCGGENVASTLPLDWGAVGLETYYTWNPDVVIVCHTDRERLLRRPGWDALRDRTIFIDPDIFARPSIRFLEHIDLLFNAVHGGRRSGPSGIDILLDIRLPRVLLAFLAGALLAGAGGLFQGVFRNPLADPFVLGAASGSALGAVFSIVTGIGMMELFAFLSGVAALFLVLVLSRVRGRLPVLNLLLCGFAVGSLASALVSLLLYAGNRDAGRIIFWLMGGFSTATWNGVLFLFPMTVILALVMFAFSRELNAMSLGEETARTMGVPAERVKWMILLTGALATSATVALCGVIGFVGLIVPHTARLLVGPDHRRLLPASLILGGILLVLSDTLARTALAPAELPVGIVTALFGVPFFLFLLRRR
ncbi:MAG: hypothetical protein A2Z34_10535 [Planctomycetes bacterium RBG_16_59_8]|nr:MAG: hypothetical protein A2Z34_10535 [Planctomycetes bacterium RBG_16_59_8]